MTLGSSAPWRRYRGQSAVAAGLLAVLGTGVLSILPGDAAVVLVAVVLAAVGLFRAAPLLVREPTRLALLVRLGELSGTVVLAGLALGVLLTVEAAPVPGVVPAAWWLFAFVLGTTAGVLVRRPLPAVAVTLAGFLVAYVFVGVTAGVSVGHSTRDQWTEAGILLVATTLLGGALAVRAARRGAST